MPLVVDVDLTRLRDPALLPIGEKLRRGERLTRDDGVTLFRSPDLLGVGSMADAANSAASRRPGHVCREPAHQPHEHLRAAQDVRVLWLRETAKGRRRIPLFA